MVYIVNKTRANVDLLRGKYIIPPLGWKEVADEVSEDPNVLYALERDWIKVSKTKPKADPNGVPPAIIEFFDPSSALTPAEVNEMLGKQNERLAKIKDEDHVDHLEDKSVHIHAKALKTNEISEEEVKAASAKAKASKKTTDPAPAPVVDTTDLGSFT